MNAHPIDTEALRMDARRVISDPYGGALETWWASHALRALDALAAAEHERDQAVGTALTAQQALDQMEHRATRAEAQSETRRIDIEYWQGVARGNAIAADVWKESAEEAEARIKAVRDVLDNVEAGRSWFQPVDFSGTPFPLTVDTADIRAALDS